MRRHLTVVAVAVALSAGTAQAGTNAPAPPNARDFAVVFVGATNAYSQVHAESLRLKNAHCVEAARGRYMCAYSAVRAGHPAECHLVQASWTPNSLSTFTITLTSRTPLCGSLREALDSLTR